MKIIAKRYVDSYAPGGEIPAGRYDADALDSLLRKGHLVIEDDEQPGTAADLEPEKAQAAADKRREQAVKKFAAAPREAHPVVTVEGRAEIRHEPAPVDVARENRAGFTADVIEEIPEAKSDTVTRQRSASFDADGNEITKEDKAGKGKISGKG